MRSFSPIAVQLSPTMVLSRASTALIACLICGYWGFGKSFAYLGVGGVFVGEIGLMALLAILVVSGSCSIPRRWSVFALSCLLLLLALQIVLSQDARLFGWFSVGKDVAFVFYCGYAFVTHAVLSEHAASSGLSRYLLRRVAPTLVPVVLLGLTISAAAYVLFPDSLPTHAGTDVAWLYFKPTDASVPLAAIMLLSMLRYIRAGWGLWSGLLLAVCAARSRSAMLTVAVIFALSMRNKRAILITCSLVLLGLATLAATDARVEMGYREISFQQYAMNFFSVFNPESAVDAADFDPTSEWRLAWWRAILDESWSADRLVTGRGWGANLADEFGFQTAGAHTLNRLRNPHNVWLGVLARGGWLAAGAVVLTFLLIAWELWQDRIRARSVEDRNLYGIILACFVIAMIHASTDVYLESPQNAIPLWTLIGVGWAIRQSPCCARGYWVAPPRPLNALAAASASPFLTRTHDV